MDTLCFFLQPCEGVTIRAKDILSVHSTCLKNNPKKLSQLAWCNKGVCLRSSMEHKKKPKTWQVHMNRSEGRERWSLEVSEDFCPSCFLGNKLKADLVYWTREHDFAYDCAADLLLCFLFPGWVRCSSHEGVAAKHPRGQTVSPSSELSRFLT